MKYTVFCGSSSGSRASFKSEAFLLGSLLANRGVGLVFGGRKVGLMGALADGALSRSGEVIGVFESFLLDKEVLYPGLTQLIEVEDIAQRKKQLIDLSDAFIALPGGFGTLEGFFEVIDMVQLGLFKRPIGLLNLEGFYDPLLLMLEQMVEQGFVAKQTLDVFVVANNAVDLLDKLEHFTKSCASNEVSL